MICMKCNFIVQESKECRECSKLICSSCIEDNNKCFSCGHMHDPCYKKISPFTEMFLTRLKYVCTNTKNSNTKKKGGDDAPKAADED